MEKSGKVKVVKYNPKKPHPDLIQDENGLFTLKKRESVMPPAMEFGVKAVKFFSPTRVCPIHGEVRVTSRNFSHQSHCVEGLSCGHTLLISRRRGELKPIRKDGQVILPIRYPAINKTVMGNPKFWLFGGWRLNFKPTF